MSACDITVLACVATAFALWTSSCTRYVLNHSRVNSGDRSACLRILQEHARARRDGAGNASHDPATLLPQQCMLIRFS